MKNVGKGIVKSTIRAVYGQDQNPDTNTMLHNITYRKNLFCFKRLELKSLLSVWGLLLGLMLLVPGLVQAQVCQSVFINASPDFIVAKNPGQQKVLDFIQGPIFKRFLRNPEVQALSARLHQHRGDISSLNSQWDGSSAEIKKSFSDNKLSYNILSIFVREDGSHVDIGGRSKRLNMEFPKVLAAVFSAAKKDIELHPELQTFELKAGNVVNPMLIQMLKDMGFKKTDPAILVPGAPVVSRDMLMGTPPNFMVPVTRVETEVGRTWGLSFQINR